jgi:hypothetical protein
MLVFSKEKRMRLAMAFSAVLLMAPTVRAQVFETQAHHVVSHADLHGSTLALPLGIGHFTFEDFIAFPEQVLRARIDLAEGYESVPEGHLKFDCQFSQPMVFYLGRECHAWVRHGDEYLRLYVTWSQHLPWDPPGDTTHVKFSVYQGSPVCHEIARDAFECDLGGAPLRSGAIELPSLLGGRLFIDDIDSVTQEMMVRYALWDRSRPLIGQGKQVTVLVGQREVSLSWTGGRQFSRKRYRFEDFTLTAKVP